MHAEGQMVGWNQKIPRFHKPKGLDTMSKHSEWYAIPIHPKNETIFCEFPDITNWLTPTLGISCAFHRYS